MIMKKKNKKIFFSYLGAKFEYILLLFSNVSNKNLILKHIIKNLNQK